LVKPFEVRELVARMRAVLRRHSGCSIAATGRRDYAGSCEPRTLLSWRTRAASGARIRSDAALTERPGTILSRATSRALLSTSSLHP
jgi:DNA-binding response OmpR family regulator